MWEVDLREYLDLIYYAIRNLWGQFYIIWDNSYTDLGTLFFAFLIIKGLISLFFKDANAESDGWSDDDFFD